MNNEKISLEEAKLIWKTLPHHTSKIQWSASERFSMKTLLEIYSEEDLNEGVFTEYQLRATIMRETGIPHFEYKSNIAKAAVFAYNLAIEKASENVKINYKHIYGGVTHSEINLESILKLKIKP